MDPETAILAANDRFYQALSLADMAQMERLWLDVETALCVHPGREPLYGWPAIREGWERIFAGQGVVRVWPSEAFVRLAQGGQTAEVTCVEIIDTGHPTGLARSRANNIFRLADGRWRLIEHHAHSMPPARREKRLGRFSEN